VAITQESNPQLRSNTLYRSVWRACLALCILLAPLALVLWFGLCPTGAGDPACPDQGSSLAVLSAFRAMTPPVRQTFLFLSLLIPFIYPVSYIGLGLLAVERSPWLATLGVMGGFAAGIVWGSIAGQMTLLDGMAQLTPSPLFVTIESHFFSSWMTLTLAAIWLFGHLGGYVLLGIALLRARAIPRWAAWLLIGSPLLMGPIAYGTGLGLLQILGFALVFVASAPAAFAMLRRGR
jgi:hypothetical protein